MKKIDASLIVKTGLFLAIALIFQIGFRQFSQPLVGPLVNMTLFLAAWTVGTISGVLIGLITPIVAFMFGIMPLFPVVPFIAVGNALLVIVSNITKAKIKNKFYEKYVAIIMASIVKYLFLALSVRYLVVLFIPKIPEKIIITLSLPQLYTALLGGGLAIVLSKFIQRSKTI